MSDAEFLSDLLRRGILALERKRRRPRGHVHTRNFLQHGQQLFADAIGKIFAPFVVAQVNERQDGDGFLVRRIRWSGRRNVNRHRLLIFT